MTEPLVSVVIPIYNVEDYLDRCIQSVVNQTYTNLEIILVDDGSKDSCPEICHAWEKKDNRIKAVHKDNAGLGMARNTGIENTRGKYVCFLDSDDYLDLSTVEECVTSAEGFDAQLVCFYSSDLYDDGTIRRNEIKITDAMQFTGEDKLIKELYPAMLTYKLGFGVSACMKLFDLRVIKAYNLRFKSERELISEDTLFVMEYISRISRALVIPKHFYYYYKREGSLTKAVRLDRQEKNDVFYCYCRDYVSENSLPETVINHLAVRYHMYTLGALKQILASDLSKKDKNKALKKIYNSEVLRSTLGKEVLSLENTNSKLFFLLLKFRCYFVCNLLLKAKMR